MENRKKLTWSLLVIFLLNLLLIGIGLHWAPDAWAATYRQGSQGDMVKKIQQKLKNEGLYAGNIDGIYGPKTAEAVKQYQKKYGLTADGICGPKTLGKMGLQESSSSSPDSQSRDNDVNLLARLISAEARGEPYEGQVAVGAVVLNRVKHPSFPNTLSGVIYQKNAFSCINDGNFNKAVVESAYKAAQDAINGVDPSGGAIYYYNPKTATHPFVFSRPTIKDIGKHRFAA